MKGENNKVIGEGEERMGGGGADGYINLPLVMERGKRRKLLLHVECRRFTLHRPTGGRHSNVLRRDGLDVALRSRLNLERLNLERLDLDLILHTGGQRIRPASFFLDLCRRDVVVITSRSL